MAPVVGLLFRRRPATIAGLVALIVFDAVECEARGAFAHVGEKVLEQKPPFANPYSPTAIKLKPIRSRIKAALLHASPGVVGGREFLASVASRVTMLRPGDAFVSLATATDRMSARQIVANDDGVLPAIADAHPARVLVVRMGETKNRQSAKTLTRQIAEGGHG